MRNLLFNDFVVECGHDDVGVFDGLALSILEIERGQLDLERTSETKWKYRSVVEIPQSTHQLSVVASSTAAREYGRVILVNHDWANVQESGSLGKDMHVDLKRDFEMNEIGKLSLSLRVHISMSLDNLSMKPSTILRESGLFQEVDDPIKAKRLHLLGNEFLHAFKTTQDAGNRQVDMAIGAYKEAVACLSVDDSRLGRFVMDICNAYQERYAKLGQPDDLHEAIRMGQTAIAVTPEGHTELPTLLSNLGNAFLRRFELTRDLDDTSQAIQYQQRAVQLTPDGHADLPNMLYDLGNAFFDRFEHNGDVGDITQAIQCYQSVVQLTPHGHADLPGRLNNLGISFFGRFKDTGDLDDLSEAIQSHQRAVQLTPDGHSDLPGRLGSLGTAFIGRFKHTGDLKDISQAVQNLQRAIQLTPDGDARLSGRFNNLGCTFLRLFERTGDMEDLSQAIQNQQSAIQLTPEGGARMPARLINLGSALLRRFKRTGDMEDLSQAIQSQQHAIQLTPDGHADLPTMFTNLGAGFFIRFEHTGNMEDISQAIRNQQRAIQLTPDEHADLPSMFNNLGNKFSCRFEHTGDLDDIGQAIQNHCRAVQLTPDGHADLPIRLTNLGVAFSCRFEHIGDLEDISQAIQNQQHAVHLIPDGHAELGMIFSNLGIAFLDRFEHTGDLDDISQAIHNQQRAVQLTPGAHVALPCRLTNLGNAFCSRFERIGDLDDISQAIQNHQRAVQLTPDGHTALPAWLNNLGNAFLRRFEYTGVVDDIFQAIEIQRRAIQLTPVGQADLPWKLNNLGNSVRALFNCTQDLDDISEAIRNHQRAVQLTPDGHVALPAWLNNLGLAFAARFKYAGDLEDISQSIKSHQRSVQLIPDGHVLVPTFLNNLGSTLLLRSKSTGDLDDICQAIQSQQLAIQLTPDGHADLPVRLDSLGRTFLQHFEHTKHQDSLAEAVANFRLSSISPTGSSLRLNSAKRWVKYLQQQPDFSSSELLDAHACIIQLLSRMSALGNTVQYRYEVLENFSQLLTAASAAALALDRPDKALEWLTEARCIVWNQIKQLRTPLDELRTHDRVLAEQFSTTSRELEFAGSYWEPSRIGLSMDDKISSEEQAGRHTKLARDWDAQLATIRNIPGFENFLQPRKYADIMQRLPSEGTIIIINVDKDRCDALVLMSVASAPLHIQLPNFSYHEAERLASGLRGHLLRFGIRSRKGTPLNVTDPLPSVDLDHVLTVLWSDVVWPILDALALSPSDSSETLPRLWWCPTGPLAFLPIHAAGLYVRGQGIPKKCLSDFAVSSYIPTLNDLLEMPALDSINVKERENDPTTGLLILSQPNTPNKIPIPYVTDEVEKINRQLQVRGIPFLTLDGQEGTVNRLLESMESFPCIHLACHASQNMENPLKSSIFLHDGQLELGEIMKRNLLHSDFAFLSACQTTKGDEILSEEVVHLAAGMLAAGYRSVVGTMWSVFDIHGPDIAELFYECLLPVGGAEGPKLDGAGAARALHHATRRFRERKVSSESPEESLLAWVPYIHVGI